MKKILITLIIVIVLGGAGIALWAYQQSNSVANDPKPSVPTSESSLQPDEVGTPVEVEPTSRTATLDPRNNEIISGSVTLTGNTIRLEDDFKTENGPDLFLYIGDATDRKTEITKLKAANGAQNYTLPDTIDPDSVTHIWIYCRAFDLNFAVAEL